MKILRRKAVRIGGLAFLCVYLVLLAYYLGILVIGEARLFPRRFLHPPNVLLISIDTLRADHLGCYGYGRDTSPTIDRLAGEGVLFRNAVAQSSVTTGSHLSLMTSLYPTVHGVNMHPDVAGNRLNPNVVTMAEKFKAYGYRTGAFTGGGGVSNTFGFGEGFDTYEEGAWTSEFGRLAFNPEEDAFFRWIEENKDDRFFLFFHTYMCHDPYTPPAPFNTMFDPGYEGDFPGSREECDELSRRIRMDSKVEMERDVWMERRTFLERLAKNDPSALDHMIALYDGGIRWTDSFLGKVLRKIEELGLADGTIIVLTSDHGEEFMEHGGFWHTEMYGETLHVPLIIVYPGVVPKGIVIDQVVRSIDIYPTLMEAAGIPVRHMVQGVSLLPAIRGKELRLEAFSEELAGGRSMARSGGWKYIEHGYKSEKKLYNVNADPEEKSDLYEEGGEERARMLDLYSRWHSLNRHMAGKYTPSRKQEMDESTIEQLRALGYLQ